MEKYIKDECIQLFQKRLSERMANGKCRMEVARPKRTVVTLFDMQKFHKFRLPYRKINTPTMNVCLRVLDSEDKRDSRLNAFLVSSCERPIVSDFTSPVASNLEIQCSFRNAQEK